MTAAPPPLTPARSDLKDFGFMPLEIVRFRGSGLIAESSAEGALAAIMLWTAAWHETPAASLVDNDRVLANAAGFGRAVAAWLLVKEEALRGWIKCSDGRLYHPIVARLANEAWKSKIEQRWRTEVGRRKKWNERHPDDLVALPTFESFAAHYPDDCPSDKIAASQGQLVLDATARTAPETDDDGRNDEKTRQAECREDMGEMSQGQGGNVAATDPQCRADLASKGQGESRDRDRDSITATPPFPPEDLMSLTQRLTQAAGVSIIKPSAVAREMDIVKRWKEAGIDVDGIIIPAIERKVRDMRDDDTVGSLALFDPAILKAHSLASGRTKSASRSSGPAATLTDKDDADPRVETLRSHLRKSVGPQTYDRWMKPGTTAIHVNGEETTIKAASSFMADWISSNMSAQLRASASAAGCPPDIRIETP